MDDKRTLLFVMAALISLSYITPLLRLHDNAQLGIALLFSVGVWDAITRLHREHKIERYGNHSLLSGIGIGALVIANFKFYSLHLVMLTPLIGGLLLVIFFFNTTGLKTYWRELLILSILSVRQIVTPLLPDPSVVTAMFSSLSLNLVGFNSSVDGQSILINSEAIRVFRGCSGLEYMTYLLSLSGLAMLLFPLKGLNRYVAFMISIAIGFLINSLRVSLLVVLSLNDNMASFDYWHEGDGSLLFGAVAVGLFGFYYLKILNQNKVTRSCF